MALMDALYKGLMTVATETVFIKQPTSNKIYTFLCRWARVGGPLYGQNFLTDICDRKYICGTQEKETGLSYYKGVWFIDIDEELGDDLLSLLKQYAVKTEEGTAPPIVPDRLRRCVGEWGFEMVIGNAGEPPATSWCVLI